MEQKQITTSKGSFLVKEISENIVLDEEYIFEFISDKNVIYSHILIAKLNDLTEEQASEIVDEGFDCWLASGYVDYNNENQVFVFALESLNSLLEANGIDKWNKEQTYLFKVV